jgi:hypothetical protein
MSTTAVNEKHISLFSEETETVPSSVIFNYATSKDTPLITVTTGEFSSNLVKYTYDESVVDTMIALTDTGSIVMKYVNVTASNPTAATVAPNSFISVSGGGCVSLTQLRFEAFKSSAAVISMDGISSLLVFETVVINLNFSEVGAFIVGSNSDSINCTVSIIGTNFSSLNGAGLNGTIIRADGVISTVLISSCVIGPSIVAGNGGALFLASCISRIDSSNFSECSAPNGGRGGAIYFGLGTSFTLDETRFSSCSAMYGGAIFSNSEEQSERRMNEVIFSGNAVGAGGNGNDVADNSFIAISLYSPLTVTNCQSKSANSASLSNFFLIQSSVSYDCLLSTSGCLSDVLHVTPLGVDSSVCGLALSPCRSLNQAAYNLNFSGNSEGNINVVSGDYTDTYLSVSSIDLVILSSSDTKPVVSLISPNAGLLFRI